MAAKFPTGQLVWTCGVDAQVAVGILLALDPPAGGLAKAERDPQIIRRIRRVQDRLDKIFGANDTGNHFQVIASKMEKVIDLFTRFRTILRLAPGATLKSSVSMTLREEVIRSKN